MRLLFNWHYYHRDDLTWSIYEACKADELTFIDRFAPDGQLAAHGHTVYWSEFTSPYRLLDAVRPDKVVFSDIESFWQLALNIAAKNRNIPTLVLQHGARNSAEMAAMPDAAHPVELSGTSRRTLEFLLRALRPQNLAAAPALGRFIVDRKRFELTKALSRNRFDLRRADRYIEYSADNASYHEARDGVSRDRFEIIGNPSLDPFFSTIDAAVPDVASALLIDAPFLEAGGLRGRMTGEEKASYLIKLGDVAAARGMRLTVKLHPLTGGGALPHHPAIDYQRDGEITKLAGRASLIIHLHYSTLTAPLVLKRPFLAFDNGLLPTPPFIDSDQLHPLLSFNPDDIGQPEQPLPWEQIEPYLGFCDGRSIERLTTVLHT